MDYASVEDETDVHKVESGGEKEEGYVKIVLLLLFHAASMSFHLNFLKMIFYVIFCIHCARKLCPHLTLISTIPSKAAVSPVPIKMSNVILFRKEEST